MSLRHTTFGNDSVVKSTKFCCNLTSPLLHWKHLSNFRGKPETRTVSVVGEVTFELYWEFVLILKLWHCHNNPIELINNSYKVLIK